MKKHAITAKPEGPRGATAPATKTCLNPNCGRPFVPGHYGDKQLVCTGTYLAKCRKCKGKECRRCGGVGSYNETCQAWYRKFWGQTRRPPRAIPDADFQRILGAVKDEPFWWTYFVVARESALRKGEQLGLVWSDVLDGDAVRSSFIVRGQWKDGKGFKPTKTDAGRFAFLLPGARDALAKYARTMKRENGWLGRRIWDVTASSVWSRFVGIQSALGIANPDTHNPYRVHDIRHTAALRSYKATRDITRTQKLLGHKRAATSMIYTEERPEDFVKDLEAKMAAEDAKALDDGGDGKQSAGARKGRKKPPGRRGKGKA